MKSCPSSMSGHSPFMIPESFRGFPDGLLITAHTSRNLAAAKASAQALICQSNKAGAGRELCCTADRMDLHVCILKASVFGYWFRLPSCHVDTHTHKHTQIRTHRCTHRCTCRTCTTTIQCGVKWPEHERLGPMNGSFI